MWCVLVSLRTECLLLGSSVLLKICMALESGIGSLCVYAHERSTCLHHTGIL